MIFFLNNHLDIPLIPRMIPSSFMNSIWWYKSEACSVFPKYKYLQWGWIFNHFIFQHEFLTGFSSVGVRKASYFLICILSWSKIEFKYAGLHRTVFEWHLHQGSSIPGRTDVCLFSLICPPTFTSVDNWSPEKCCLAKPILHTYKTAVPPN